MNRICTVATTLLLVSCAQRARLIGQEEAQSDRAGIYAAAIEAFAVGPDTRMIVLSARTRPSSFKPDTVSETDSLRPFHIGGARRDTWRDFQLQNLTPQRVPSNLQLSVPIALVDAPRLQDTGSGRGYLKDYPEADGIVSVSGVGLSADRKEALVEVNYSCGTACAHTMLFRLVRHESSWSVADRLFEQWAG